MGVPEISGGGVLGEKVQGARRRLDTFEFPNHKYLDVTYTSDEVTSLCPITGQPDFYTVKIMLEDSFIGLESKSLKLYLQSFRDDGNFCEAFADMIAADVYSVIKPTSSTGPWNRRVRVTVTVNQKARGGVSIEAKAARA